MTDSTISEAGMANLPAAANSEPRVIGPVVWEGYPGFNLEFTGYSAGHYSTGAPHLGWCLYSQGGHGWEQRTKKILPPEPGAEPRRIGGEWVWAQPTAGPGAARKSLVICLDGATWDEISGFLDSCADHVRDCSFRLEEPEAVRFMGGSGHEMFWSVPFRPGASLESTAINSLLRRVHELTEQRP